MSKIEVRCVANDSENMRLGLNSITNIVCVVVRVSSAPMGSSC